MTSVVDTQVKHFHSGMVGAPVLNGVAGSMLGVLDACLRDGFDLKAVTTLAVAAGVATLSFAGSHSATVDSVVLVAGADIAALNGEQKVTAIGSGFVKFATAAAPATATGTITFKMAGAGWLTPFTGTNLRVYKSADPASTGMLLRVDDTPTTNSRVIGYEAMSDVNTGTGPFPKETDITGGGHWPKSSSAGTNPVSWTLMADGRKFIFSSAPFSASNPINIGGCTRGFGDDISARPGGDPYACTLSYADTGAPSDTTGVLDYNIGLNHATPRGHSGLGSCVRSYCLTYTGNYANLSGQDSFFGTFPSAVDGGLRLSKKFFAININQPPRSELAGLYHVPMSNMSAAFGLRDVISGTGTMAGRKLMALLPTNSPTSNGTSNGISFVDITGPWR
jgi:hypothetical protein